MKRIIPATCLLMVLGFWTRAQGNEQGKEKLELSKQEQQILDLTNQERANLKLPALKPNAILFQAARGHSANMAAQDKLEHDLDGKSAFDRIKAAGYKYERAGENIAIGGADIARIVQGWMDSPPHRANILGDAYTEIGLGMAKDAKGKFYYTQVFGKSRK